jgi:hypothetical protein
MQCVIIECQSFRSTRTAQGKSCPKKRTVSSTFLSNQNPQEVLACFRCKTQVILARTPDRFAFNESFKGDS